MIDGIIKDTGDSRRARGNFPATYEEFRAMAAAGTLPLDILFNAIGWQQQPTFLNKGTLLSDPVSQAIFGNALDHTVSEALGNLGDRIKGVETGSYVGTGVSGAANPNSLTFSFQPKIVGVVLDRGGAMNSGNIIVYGQANSSGVAPQLSSSSNAFSWAIVWDGNMVSWYETETSAATSKQLNYSGWTYRYFAIG